MVISKVIKIDSTYESSFVSSNASWWNSNVDIVIASPESWANSNGYSWYTGKKIVSVNIHKGYNFDYPLVDNITGAQLYVPYPSRTGPFELLTQDIRASQYKVSWISYMKNLIDAGATGLYIERVTLDEKKSMVLADGSNPSGDYSWWSDSITDFLEEISSELKDYSFNSIIIHDTDWKDGAPRRWEEDNTQRQIMSADYVYLNGIPTDPTLNNLSSQNPITDDRGLSFRSMLTYVDYTHACKTNIIYAGDNTTNEKFKFSFATYYLTYSSGDAININGQVVSSPLSTVVTTDYGNPASVRADQNSDPNNAGYIYREYTQGYVRVTPLSYPTDQITENSSIIAVDEPSNELALLNFPATPLVDNFNTYGAVNSNILISPFYGTIAVENKQFGPGDRVYGTGQGADAATKLTHQADQEVWYDNSISNFGGVWSEYEIYARLTKNEDDEITCYCLKKTSSQIQLIKIINNTRTTLHTANISSASAYWIGMRLNGNSIKLYTKATDVSPWTSYATVINNDISTSGKIGFTITNGVVVSGVGALGPNNFGGGSLVIPENHTITTPNTSYLNIEELSSGSAIDFIKGSGLSKKGIESILEYSNIKLNDSSKHDEYRISKIDGLFDIDIRDNRVNLPNSDGEIAQRSRYSGRTITIEGEIRAHTREKLLDMETALQMAFYSLEEKPLVFRTGDIRRDFYINCKKTQPISMAEEQVKDLHSRMFTVTLRASDPYFYSVNTKETSLNIDINNTPTVQDDFSTNKLLEPEYFDSGSSYSPSDTVRSSAFASTVGQDNYFKFDSTNNRITEKKQNTRFGIYHKQNTNYPNFTQIVKARFSKIPVNHPGNSAVLPTIKYPVVTFASGVKELKSGEKYPKKLILNNFNIKSTTNGSTTTNVFDLTEDLDVPEATKNSWLLSPYEKPIDIQGTSIREITLLEGNPNNNWTSTTNQLYGSGNNYSNYFPTSPIIENINASTQLAINTDYWFSFSSTLLNYTNDNGINIPYRINTKRIYDQDPLGGTNPTPIVSTVYRSKDWGSGNLGIATANTDYGVNVTMNDTALTELPTEELQAYGLNVTYAFWSKYLRLEGNGVNQVFKDVPQPFFTLNLASLNKSVAALYKWNVNYSGRSSSSPDAPAGYINTDVTTYDDYKLFNYDINSPVDTPSVAKVVLNSGSSNAKPIFTVTGDMEKSPISETVLTIKNLTNNKIMTFNTTTIGEFIPNGEQLVIDCKNKKIYLKSSGLDYAKYLSFDSDWIDLNLGENTIELSGASMVKSDTSVKFQDIYL